MKTLIVMLASLAAGAAKHSDCVSSIDARSCRSAIIKTVRSSGPSACVPVAGVAFDDTWTSRSSPTGPTLTLNDSTSPACTTTAARLQVPAVTALQYSTIRVEMDAYCPDTINNVLSVWVRSHDQISTGTVDLGRQNNNFTNDFGSLGFTGTWTLVTRTIPGNSGVGNNAGRMLVGNAGLLGASPPEAAIDIDIWGPSCI